MQISNPEMREHWGTIQILSQTIVVLIDYKKFIETIEKRIKTLCGSNTELLFYTVRSNDTNCIELLPPTSSF
jgi:hypothetical protein